MTTLTQAILRLAPSAGSSKYVSALSSMHFYPDGFAVATDGTLYLRSPCPKIDDQTLSLPAGLLSKFYLRHPNATMVIHDTFAQLSAAKSRAKLPLNREAGVLFDGLEVPAGYKVADLHPEFFDGLENLGPFISDDASTPWACAVLLQGNRAYATNNVSLCYCDIEADPSLRAVVPKTVFNELMRLQQTGQWTELRQRDGVLTFVQDTGVTLTCGETAATWPPDIERMIRPVLDGFNGVPIDSEFKEALAALKPFYQDEALPILELQGDAVAYTGQSVAATEHLSRPLSSRNVRLHARVLAAVAGVATAIDFEPTIMQFKHPLGGGIFMGMFDAGT